MEEAPPEALRRARERPHRTALFTDYDGTLAPIVADPAAAGPLPGVPGLLAELGQRLGRVIVVSGRPAVFLAGQLGTPPGVELRGVYGMEQVTATGEIELVEAARPWRRSAEEALRRAEREAPKGVEIESKAVTVTLHWRAHPTSARAAQTLADEIACEVGLIAQPGRMSVELRPPLALDKGTVVVERGAGFDPVLYLGDDLGDLPGFRALDVLHARGAAVARVGVADPESPPELTAAADLLVEGPTGLVALLRRWLLPDAGEDPGPPEGPPA